ncbi:serine hydrolase domain-containing protein [Galbibacter sp. PAP.153]|uniref:serine hydrolase domain-containing protein n=1 Tax=Galbibacter sp. PAP.153 TaxID=3104623 RepID=UPI003008E5B2
MKNTFFLKCLLTVTSIFFLNYQSICHAQNIQSNIDSLMQKQYRPHETGASFLIAKKGKIIYKKAFGLSNLELNVPMEPDNVFEIGSITKQFTAIAILMLMEEGKLNLEDTITKFIPDYPHGNKITIHHLLTHTSGIKDFTSVDGLNEISKKDMTPTALINFFKNEPMDFLPGQQYKYSNSGYILLGYIIETVSAESYAHFIEQHIFKKLQLKNTYYASHKKIINNRASGYQKKDGKYINNTYISFSLPYSAGSIMSTVTDMYKWNQAIKDNLLISKQTTKKAFTNYTLNNGTHIDYGYGWHIKTKNNVQRYEHGGSIFGYKSMGVYLPAQDIYVIGLTNCNCNSPTQITKEIAQLVAEN